MVYVCDRTSNRIQIFQKDGKFVKEAVVSKETKGATVGGQFGAVSSFGSVWDLAFSNDPQQRFVYVADGHDKKVIVLQRDSLAPVGSVGSGGRLAGQFLAVGSIAVDSRGNVYLLGQLDLDGLVTRTYSLDDINKGYDAMRNGENIRGVIVY